MRTRPSRVRRQQAKDRLAAVLRLNLFKLVGNHGAGRIITDLFKRPVGPSTQRRRKTIGTVLIVMTFERLITSVSKRCCMRLVAANSFHSMPGLRVELYFNSAIAAADDAGAPVQIARTKFSKSLPGVSAVETDVSVRRDRSYRRRAIAVASQDPNHDRSWNRCLNAALGKSCGYGVNVVAHQIELMLGLASVGCTASSSGEPAKMGQPSPASMDESFNDVGRRTGVNHLTHDLKRGSTRQPKSGSRQTPRQCQLHPCRARKRLQPRTQ